MHLIPATWFRAAAAALMAVAVIVSIACSENNGDTVRPTPGEAATVAGSVVLEIAARDYAFSEDELQLRQGQRADIRFTNQGSQKHSLAVYEDEDHQQILEDATIEPIGPGETETSELEPPRGATKLFFRCEIHKEMAGVIEIGPDTEG